MEMGIVHERMRLDHAVTHCLDVVGTGSTSVQADDL